MCSQIEQGGEKSYYDFYKIMHEHLFVFRKPKKEENNGSNPLKVGISGGRYKNGKDKIKN